MAKTGDQIQDQIDALLREVAALKKRVADLEVKPAQIERVGGRVVLTSNQS